MSHSPITVIYLQLASVCFDMLWALYLDTVVCSQAHLILMIPGPGIIACFSKESWFLLETKVGAKCDAAAAAAAAGDF